MRQPKAEKIAGKILGISIIITVVIKNAYLFLFDYFQF